MLTGPGFVTQDNAAQIKELSANGTASDRPMHSHALTGGPRMGALPWPR